MKEKLLSYLLDDLNPAERAEVEAALASDPALQQELVKLQQCMGPCEEAEPDSVPPTQLAKRTCCFVDHAIQKSQAVYHSAAGVTKRLSENRDPCNRSRSWTMADFIGAVCVCAALGGLIIPALRDTRDMARNDTCKNNLRQLGVAAMNFSLFHEQGPPQIGPQDNAGMFVVNLVESGFLSQKEAERIVVCPDSQLAERIANGCVVIYLPARKELLAASSATRERWRKFMGGSYAYPIGYVDTAGKLQRIHFGASRVVPMVADAPSPAIAGYQSANHGGCGQNVLFQDLSCRYSNQCKCAQKKDHWYLNDAGQTAAGLHAHDTVLGGSEVVPVIKQLPAK
jgi:hypothetical protein